MRRTATAFVLGTVLGAGGWHVARFAASTVPEVEKTADAELGFAQERSALDVAADASAELERLLAPLRPEHRVRVRLDALSREAEADPRAAFASVLEVSEPAVMRLGALAVMTTWGRSDPEAALAEASRLPAAMQREVKRRIALEWAWLDAPGLIEALGSRVVPEDLNTLWAAADVLAARDPAGFLAALDAFTDDAFAPLRRAALSAMVETDVQAALARIEAMPAGNERDLAFQAVAHSYARRDPESALAWAKRLAAPAAVFDSLVLTVADAGDFTAAYDLVARGVVVGAGADRVLAHIAQEVAKDANAARRFADALLERADEQANSLLERVVSRWFDSDPATAANWMLANEWPVDTGRLASLAARAATRSPAVAAAYTDEFPDTLRSLWISQVAGPYVLVDAEGAMRWLERYHGQEAYDVALREVARHIARRDPLSVVDIVGRLSAEFQLAAAPPVAASWAFHDPEQAALWAVSLSDPQARSSTVAVVAGAWARADPAAAESWARSLPYAPLRDDALAAMSFWLRTSGAPRRAADELPSFAEPR